MLSIECWNLCPRVHRPDNTGDQSERGNEPYKPCRDFHDPSRRPNSFEHPFRPIPILSIVRSRKQPLDEINGARCSVDDGAVPPLPSRYRLSHRVVMDIAAAGVGHAEGIVDLPIMRLLQPTALMGGKPEQPGLVDAEPLCHVVDRSVERIEKRVLI